ncbi:AraC family transcriptional regulator [Candidatus Dojkabacteria bacterium]|uniref:AraC family transcriptional regulator n=1 Tax=Candidatus Dojkabacteria bacterium TaxID=2099670 RepID=A0A847EV18_9BACT|nr:AraC family transcriptional regulator [Candidatus Dojkabacteria bacterium]
MKPEYYENGVPVFTKDSFFRPGEHVYIHKSTDFSEFVGVVHKHEFIEFVYIMSGKANHVINNLEYTVMQGDLVIINYDATHVFYEDKSFGEPFVTYDLMFTPDYLDVGLIRGNNFNSLASSFLFYSLFPEKQSIGPDLHLSGTHFNIFGELFDKIYFEFIKKQKGYVEIMRAYVVELIIQIYRQIETSSSASSSRHKHEEIVNRALKYLYDHYQTHVTLEDLAAQIFLSKDYFSRLFREITGKPVSMLLQQIRVEEACKMLISTDRTILDIASECGYQDIKFFYITFRKQTGMTPGEYRKANQQFAI